MLIASCTNEWRQAHPGAMIGFLEISQVENKKTAPALDEYKRVLEADLRNRYAGFTRQDFLSLPVMMAYQKYYKRFGKTYQVLQQLESIVLKGKNFPSVSPLVDANFMAEVDTLVLAAGHDVQQLQGPVCIDIAREGDQFIQMGGAEKSIPPGDMIMRDVRGVSCSILYGQDHLSPISPSTSHVLYAIYAPYGVSALNVNVHMEKIKENISRFSNSMVVKQQELLIS
jgi:DNA/RNA-binding domain of Phe-tRNA-synthetase-like protein